MQWIVENFHSRPGKTGNIYFKTEKIRLKNNALYIRYGSIKANYEAYCDVVPLDLKIGRYTFRKVLSAMTVKDTYNQGLSYYWVDFIDMIQFALDMLDRLGKIIINAQVIDPNQKANIELWLERARENTRYTRYTSECLRHTFYAEIEKTGTNGFTNAALDWERANSATSSIPMMMKSGMELRRLEDDYKAMVVQTIDITD
jgi:hypothetical protein